MLSCAIALPAADAQTPDSLPAFPVVQAGMPTTRAPEPSWDIDVRSFENEARVAHYVEMFSGSAKARITARLERGSRYEAMIRGKMRDGGVPEDMYYLALVESGFDQHAYSRAAAVGMWQFMTSTGRGMGLRIDAWVDERRDPIRSTGAAVRFIKGLSDQFGSLYLAAAAYNGGPGRVSRGLARYASDVDRTRGDDAFFVLAAKDYFKNETREYVPQLIAAALVAKDPSRYGMELRTQDPFAYDSVRAPGSTPLAAVATALDLDLATLVELNPQLLRGMTPPGADWQLRVPVGRALDLDSALATLPAESRVATTRVRTKQGDSHASIARAHGISTSSLTTFNPTLRKLKSGRLAPDQGVLVPSAAVAAAALDVPDPALEIYGGRARGTRTHLVKKGESVGVIAQKYGTTTRRILELNGLKKPLIRAGQTLAVSGSVPAVKPKRKPSAGSRS